jgi:putative hydrolase of the HAD superfamily
MTASSHQAADLGPIDVWLFDLDNTLYPTTSGIFAQVDALIIGYVMRLLDLELEAARALKRRYVIEHGSTLRALMDRHGVEPVGFLEEVHRVDLTAVGPSPALGAALEALPGRKLIFTNASTDHAERVLERLGVAGHFEDIFDIVAADFVPKPRPAAYDALVARHGIDPRRTVFLEDMARNLAPAAALGMTTVWVAHDGEWGRTGAEDGDIHHVADDLVAWLQWAGEAQAARR